jgi:serine/threonine protein kinase
MGEFINSRIGRYEIRERIGSGGMARVFKAWDTNLERLVAVKVLYEHLAEESTFKQRFEQEAKFVAGFNHPHIVQIYDFDSFERDGQPVYYMVMEYLPGKTLKTTLEELHESGERLPNERILEIMTDLLDALGYAHERGMIHRDVKPANILFNERGKAILTDFGIARLAQGLRLTRESVTIGTPAYMSPEQAVGGEVDARGDLYAMGIVLYEMLTGQIPFADDGSLSVLLKHINEPIPPLSQFLSTYDPGLDLVIEQALAKNPADRYQSAQEFSEDLRRAFARDIVRAARPSNAKVVVVADGGTQVVRPSRLATLTASIVQSIPPKTRQYAPIGILAAGLLLIGGVVGANLISRQTANAQQTVESMTDSMTANETAMSFESTFSEDDPTNRLWLIGADGMLQRAFLPEGGYRITNNAISAASTTILRENYVYDALIVTMEAALEEGSPAASGYGIIFHYIDDEHYNVFAVDGVGRYSIWRRVQGRWFELRDQNEQWTPNSAIRAIGETNRLTVTVLGTRLIGEVNGEVVADVIDMQTQPGNVGIYLATTDSGEDAVIRVLSYSVQPTIASMTDVQPSGDGGR